MNEFHIKCAYIKCSKIFVPNVKSRIKQIYCCSNCANKASAKRVWARKNTPRILESIKPIACMVCGDIFKPHIRNHKKQIYCSKKCMQKESRKKLSSRIKNDPRSATMNRETRQVQRANRSAIIRFFYKEFSSRKGEAGTISVKDWRDIKNRFSNRCADCGIKETELAPLTIDHVKSISDGGRNVAENIEPRCDKCNREKYMKSIRVSNILS